jgi:hypothetical protein
MRLRLLPLLGVVLLACERAPFQTGPADPANQGAGDEFDGHHSHFRYGTMSWAPTGNPGEVRFRLRAGFRRDAYFPLPSTGDFLQDEIGETIFDLGDGNVSAILVPFIVTAHSETENWIIVEAVDFSAEPFGPGIPHTYAGSGPFTAQLGGPLGAACCRLEGPQVIAVPPFLIPGLKNRAGRPYPLPATVSPFSGNSSPVSAMAPVVVVPANPAATFFVPATDPDGDPLRWRLGTEAEASAASLSPDPPPGLTIDATTGQVTWNTVGLDQANFYTTTVIVEDVDASGAAKSSIPVDFFLRIRPQFGIAPSCAVNPAGPLSATVGEPLSFNVTASDPDVGASVTLNSAGMPSVPESDPALPVSGASPQSSTITWTPGDALVGTHVAVFTATDENALQGLCSVTITVEAGSGGGGGGDPEVEIDIKPGSDDNPINLKSRGKIPVAVLTTADFDAASLDPATVTLGNDDGDDTPVAARNNGTLMASLEDVDQDGDLDLVLHVDTQALVRNGDLGAGTTELILNGTTTDGTPVQGRDGVRIVP